MSDTPQKVGHLYQIAVSLGDGQSISVSGNFSQGASVHEMNSEVDKIMAVVERQRAKYSMASIKEEIRRGEAHLGACLEDIKAIDERNVGKKLTVQEQNAKEQTRVTVRRIEAEIENWKAKLRTAEEAAA